jgi:hypothetical protein
LGALAQRRAAAERKGRMRNERCLHGRVCAWHRHAEEDQTHRKQKTMKDLDDNNNQVNNFEIENKICLSLFIIKKIIKDYSFYFNKAELESIFMQFKKFKEY